jgi:hypothetical protein
MRASPRNALQIKPNQIKSNQMHVLASIFCICICISRACNKPNSDICDVPVLDASAVTAMEAVAPAPGARSAVAGWGRGAASPGTSAEAVVGADVPFPVPSAPWAIFVLRSAPRPKMVSPSPSIAVRKPSVEDAVDRSVGAAHRFCIQDSVTVQTSRSRQITFSKSS